MNPGVTDHVILRDVQNGKIAHLLYARRYNPENKKLENITIQEFQNEAVIRVENAPNAVWKDGKWFMENGTIYDLVKMELAARCVLRINLFLMGSRRKR